MRSPSIGIRRTRLGAIAVAGAISSLTIAACSATSEKALGTSYEATPTTSYSNAAEPDTTRNLGQVNNRKSSIPEVESAPADTAAADTAAVADELNTYADETQAAAVAPAQVSGDLDRRSRSSYKPVPDRQPEPTARVPETAAPGPSIKSRDAGVNPTEQSDFDRFSTFAMDVDTSSYTLARAIVQGGSLPSFESVRTEEFVNYFDQQYASPKTGETFAIHVDGATAPFLAANQRVLRVGVQAERVDRADRPSAHLTFVIDTSGSMEEDGKLELVKEALRKLVDNLRADDQIAIVEFSDSARVVLGPTAADQRRRILGAIDELTPTNSTNAEAGLELGYQIAQDMRAYNSGSGGSRPDPTLNRVILASDGVANVGPDGPEAILGRIGTWSRQGIDLVTVGVGTTSYNDEMMERLADAGNGFSAYVDAPFEADRLFRDRLVSTLQTVARDAKIQVEFNPENVAAYRLIGFENRAVADSEFRNDNVDAGEVGAGHSVTALYEVTLRGESSRNSELATVRLRWDDVRRKKVVETSARVTADQLRYDLQTADPHLELDVLVAAYADVLRRGTWSRLTDLRFLADRMQHLADRLGGDVDVREFVSLVRQAATLQ